MKRLIGILIAAITLVGCSANHQTLSVKKISSNIIHVSGTLKVSGMVGTPPSTDGSITDGSPCVMLGSIGLGYSDISIGSEVVISDDAGKTLVITTLLSPVFTGDSLSCAFPFVANVQKSTDGFYGVTVTHRGTVKFSESQMSNISLTLGQ